MKRLLLSLACLPLAALPAPSALAAEPKGCTYVEVASLPMRYAGPTLEPAVDGVIEGKPATMLVDTGAFETQMTMNGVVRRDLGLHMTGRYAEGIGGSVRLYSTRLSEIGIGPVRNKRRTELLVLGESNVTPAFDAIVGAPFLLQADLEFDLRAKRMRFFRPLDCDGTALAIWKEDTIAVPVEYSRDRSPNPHFTVKVNGVELDTIIDTGAHDSFLSSRAAKRLGIDLKGPDVKRTGYSVGAGSERAPTWSTPIKTVEIGGEIIRDGELSIVEAQSELSAELYLGQDFLRAHRVLFAMSQRKLYIAYLGGRVFTPRMAVEPWVREEADSGNADAQFAMAWMVSGGRGVPRDTKEANAWLEKAAELGQPNANLQLGRRLQLAKQPDKALPKLRAALEQLPSERFGALWLYNARVRNGEAELAATELASLLKRQDRDDWPEPIARFYLGKIDAARLLELALEDKKAAKGRTCQANGYMSEWYDARGDKEKADALMAAVRAQCSSNAAPGARPASAPTSAPASTPDASNAP